jgi:SAM-dependent methyltransferase
MEKDSQEVIININDTIIDLFTSYIGNSIKIEDLKQKALEIQKKALEIQNYKCIRQGKFLEPRISFHPSYKTLILPQLENKKIIDIGCCMGTDIRKLILDGATPSNIVGIDIDKFWHLGYELFDDYKNNTLLSKINCFYLVDLLSDSFKDKIYEIGNEKFENFQGFDIVYMGSVLHLLSEEDIKKAIQHSFQILAPQGMYLGQTVACSAPTTIARETIQKNLSGKKLRFLHSPSSLKKLLEDIGFSEVKVENRNHPFSDIKDALFCTFLGIKK